MKIRSLVRGPMFWITVVVVLLVVAMVQLDRQFDRENALLAATCRAAGVNAYQCAQDSAQRRTMKNLSDAAAVAAGGLAAGAASPTRP